VWLYNHTASHAQSKQMRSPELLMNIGIGVKTLRTDNVPMFTEGAPISSPERRRQRLAGGVLQPHLDFYLRRELDASRTQDIITRPLLRQTSALFEGSFHNTD